MGRLLPGSVTGVTSMQVICCIRQQRLVCSLLFPSPPFLSLISPVDTRFCLHQLCIKARPASLKTVIFNADGKKGFSTLLFILQNQTNEWHQGSNLDVKESWEQLPPTISFSNFCRRGAGGLPSKPSCVALGNLRLWYRMSKCPSWSESNQLWWKKGRRLVVVKKPLSKVSVTFQTCEQSE